MFLLLLLPTMIAAVIDHPSSISAILSFPNTTLWLVSERNCYCTYRIWVLLWFFYLINGVTHLPVSKTLPAFDVAGEVTTRFKELMATYCLIKFPTESVVVPTCAASRESSIVATVTVCYSSAKKPNSMIASEIMRISGNARINSSNTDPVRCLSPVKLENRLFPLFNKLRGPLNCMLRTSILARVNKWRHLVRAC